MFRIWLRIAGVLASLPLAISSVSAAVGERVAAQAAWAKASQHNTLEAYVEFVIAHPDSRYVRQAYVRLSTVGAAKLGGPGIPPFEADLDVSKPGFIPHSIMVV